MNWWTARKTWQKVAIVGVGGLIGLSALGNAFGGGEPETDAASSTTTATEETTTLVSTTTAAVTTTAAPTTTIAATTTAAPTTTIAATTTTAAVTTTAAPTTTIAATTTSVAATTTTAAATTTTAAANCDPSYPDFCIPPKPPDLNCGDIGRKNFTVLPPDPHGFDGNKDGVGCQS